MAGKVKRTASRSALKRGNQGDMNRVVQDRRITGSKYKSIQIFCLDQPTGANRYCNAVSTKLARSAVVSARTLSSGYISPTQNGASLFPKLADTVGRPAEDEDVELSSAPLSPPSSCPLPVGEGFGDPLVGLHVSDSYIHVVEQKTPEHLSSQGKSSVTVGIASGQPHRCVAVARPRHAGIAHVGQSTPVTVTVGQPVCVAFGGLEPLSPGCGRVVAVEPAPVPGVAEPSWALPWSSPSRARTVELSPGHKLAAGRDLQALGRTWRQECL